MKPGSKKELWKRSGQAMTSVVIVGAIVGAVGASMFQSIAAAIKAGAKMSGGRGGEFLSIFDRQADCGRSLPGGTCAAGRIDVFSNDGSVLVSRTNGTMLGAFRIRADCANGDSVQLRATRQTSGAIDSTNVNDFQPEPGSTEVVTWADPRSLLGGRRCTLGDPASRMTNLESLLASLSARLRTAAIDISARSSRETGLQVRADVVNRDLYVSPPGAALSASVDSMRARINNMASLGNNSSCLTAAQPLRGFLSTGARECSPAANDYNGDGNGDYVTGAMFGGGPRYTVYAGPGNTVLADAFGLEPTFTGGGSVGLRDLNGDGKADVIMGAGPSGGPRVQVMFSDGTSASFYSYEPEMSAGVWVR